MKSPDNFDSNKIEQTGVAEVKNVLIKPFLERIRQEVENFKLDQGWSGLNYPGTTFERVLYNSLTDFNLQVDEFIDKQTGDRGVNDIAKYYIKSRAEKALIDMLPPGTFKMLVTGKIPEKQER